MDEIEKLKEIIRKQAEIIATLSGISQNDSEKIITNNEKLTNEKNIESKEEFKEDLHNFALFLEQQGLSDNTVDGYLTQVKLFFRTYNVMNKETLDDYATNFKFVKPKTANNRIAAMSKYFEFLGNKDFYKFRRVKTQKWTFTNNVISEDDYKKICEWGKQNNRKFWLIIKVISLTGVRVSELIAIETEWLKDGYADIVSKGNKQRRIYFPKELVNEILPYCGEKYVVENRYGEQITARGVSALLRENAIKAGIDTKYAHPHGFRHFFAKQFLKKNSDISLLGDLLGHSDISTTAIYTRMSSEEQQETLNNIVNW